MKNDSGEEKNAEDGIEAGSEWLGSKGLGSFLFLGNDRVWFCLLLGTGLLWGGLLWDGLLGCGSRGFLGKRQIKHDWAFVRILGGNNRAILNGSVSPEEAHLCGSKVGVLSYLFSKEGTHEVYSKVSGTVFEVEVSLKGLVGCQILVLIKVERTILEQGIFANELIGCRIRENVLADCEIGTLQFRWAIAEAEPETSVGLNLPRWDVVILNHQRSIEEVLQKFLILIRRVLDRVLTCVCWRSLKHLIALLTFLTFAFLQEASG